MIKRSRLTLLKDAEIVVAVGVVDSVAAVAADSAEEMVDSVEDAVEIAAVVVDSVAAVAADSAEEMADSVEDAVEIAAVVVDSEAAVVDSAVILKEVIEVVEAVVVSEVEIGEIAGAGVAFQIMIIVNKIINYHY